MHETRSRLAHEPRTFRDLVEADLLRAERLVRQVHPDPIDPQFRIASPEGDWWIAMTLTDDPNERKRRLQLVRDFMAWKIAPSFILASELAAPDAVYAIGVTHRERAGCLALIERQPLAFGLPQWMEEAQLGHEIPALLPRGTVILSEARIAELKATFGARGTFPAVNLLTREVGA